MAAAALRNVDTRALRPALDSRERGHASCNGSPSVSTMSVLSARLVSCCVMLEVFC